MWLVSFFLYSGFVLSFDPHLRYALLGASHSASTQLEATGLELTVELASISHLAEYERRLTVSSNGQRISKWMALDHGGFLRANLYRATDGKYVVAGAMDSWSITTAPLGIEGYSESYLGNRAKGLYRGRESVDRRAAGPLARAEEETASLYFSGLTYLGTFDFADATGKPAASVRAGQFVFVPAHKQREWIRDPGG